MGEAASSQHGAKRQEVQRASLHQLVQDSGRPVIVLSAPAGCGKSVFARQLAQFTGRSMRWIDCEGLDPGTPAFGVAIAEALRSGESMAAHRSVLLPAASPFDIEMLLRDVLAHAETPHLVVLDDVHLGGSGSGVATLARGFLASGDASHRLVVTTRDECVAGLGLRPEDVLVLDACSLALSMEEATEMATLADAPGVILESIPYLLELSRGRVAILDVLLRHAAASGLEPMPRNLNTRDLRHLLEYLATSQLNATELSVLYVASLVRRGRLSDLMSVVRSSVPAHARRVAECIPLMRFDTPELLGGTFTVHDLAAPVYAAPSFAHVHIPEHAELMERALQRLESTARHKTHVGLLVETGRRKELAQSLPVAGPALLRAGQLRTLRDALDSLETTDFLSDASLLVMHAKLLRELGLPQDALTKVGVARDLAHYDGDDCVWREAHQLAARLHIDLGDIPAGADALEAFLNATDSLACAEDAALTHGYLSLCAGCMGDVGTAEKHSEMAQSLCASENVSSETRGHVYTSLAGVRGLVLGYWSDARLLLAELTQDRQLPYGLHIQSLNNFAYALKELGRSDRAFGVVESALAESAAMGLALQEGALLSTGATALAARGDTKRGLKWAEKAIDATQNALQSAEAAMCRVELSTMQRASGDVPSAVATAEEALEYLGSERHQLYEWLAILETAASLLALGDIDAARTRSTKVREEAAASKALYHMLRADLILAEIETRDGLVEDAVARLRAHEEYILTESSNWQIAMYVRSFPSLLGILGTAIDPDTLPAHLLQMVLPQDAEETLRAASAVMEPDAWRRLAVRIVGEAMAAQIAGEPTAPPCRVHLFGGLGVQVGERYIAEKEWRKRKARLIFAMLVLRQGRDVPREQLMEHLWPEMEEPRARNNFYVVWSAMKGALSPQAGRGEPCPYVENTGGLCRAVRSLVHSDVDDFDVTLQRARDADSGGDSEAALRQYERLAEIYRGDLMPGDLYDDWFAAARDRYRNEFSDAMMRAAEILQNAQDPARALRLVRCALLFDPWREDLYQTALQCQIATGQRSAAIDTYMSCRSRLADDLGIDPSNKTTRLYEHVLAMEERAPAPRAR